MASKANKTKVGLGNLKKKKAAKGTWGGSRGGGRPPVLGYKTINRTCGFAVELLQAMTESQENRNAYLNRLVAEDIVKHKDLSETTRAKVQSLLKILQENRQ